MTRSPVRLWIDGREATELPALDRGLQYGDGHFTTIACRGGVLRFLDLHLERLRTASERLRIHFSAWADLATELATAAHAAPREALVKVVITRGDGLARGYGTTGQECARRIVSVWPTQLPTAADRAAGLCALVAKMRLGENEALAGMKHLNRLESVVARHEWTRDDIGESLHATSDGMLACGSMSNVFLLRADGKLVTPSVAKAGVAGIVRSLVLRECAKLGVDCEVTTLPVASVWEAAAVFVTNARFGVMPVTTLVSHDGREKRFAVAPVITHIADRLESLDA